ncbi:OmpH family outer membrane protein [Cytophaga hutchinsonii]|uniref:Outer membrane protein, ompH family n=1 Tax=Cytophaga hutchinsonii (strain ATCC 33406 / DSM 1761 / CIP 103989 / NBRC 15051 / NCIMB 9469 / D465) TaxID=269798 RepID=A0A6N4SW25_CYTH3|nr:OmpH family outer membrane protein [Cytophaga hutchinsonii]ABG60651.1 outer membrane protein, ompH family [Cytophaga hutchinsonii ATCC 33406]SFY01261.1 periplasmic chaperone for outer membrane proteins Skp [Cytophaga hutchinsonii ATCC 33406]
MHTLLRNLLLILSIVFLTAQLQAQVIPQKIGIVDVEYIINKHPDTKKIEADLQAYEDQLRKQLESKYNEYQVKLEDYKRGGSVLPPAVKADKEKELMTMQQSIQQFETTAQEDLQSKSISMLDPLLNKIQLSIDKVAAANNYTYIISTHVDSGGSAIILYAKNKAEDDISNLVLKDMGVVITPTTTTPSK